MVSAQDDFSRYEPFLIQSRDDIEWSRSWDLNRDLSIAGPLLYRLS